MSGWGARNGGARGNGAAVSANARGGGGRGRGGGGAPHSPSPRNGPHTRQPGRFGRAALPVAHQSLDLHDLSLLLHRDTRLRGACIETARKRHPEQALADGAEPSLKRKQRCTTRSRVADASIVSMRSKD